MTPDAAGFLIRPCAAGDRAALVDLLRDVWAHKRDVDREVAERWWWRHAEPPILLAVDEAGGEAAGMCAWIPFAGHAAGRDLPCAWFVDFYVRSSRQGLGLGRRLTAAVQAKFEITASLAQTDAAWRVFHGLGWQARAPVALLMHPWPARWLFRPRAGDPPVDVAPIDALERADVAADLDALWARACGAHAFLARRTAADLRARYTRHPDRGYRLLRCHDGGACTGMMIVRDVPAASPSGRRVGLLVDFLVRPDDNRSFGALAAAGARALADAGAARIYAMAPPPACRRVLAARGFLAPDTPVVGRALRRNRKWLTYHADTPPAVPPGGWFVTLGDCDLDLVWRRE